MQRLPIRFDPVELPAELEPVRARVRAFLAREKHLFEPGSLMRHSPEFTRKCAEEGLIGMTWPSEFGGGGRSFLERFVVSEELLAAGAPVWAHWVADRQSGPILIRYGDPSVRKAILPRIVRGECFFCIGMSEPNSGSDLFAASCKAERTNEGWRVNGRKIWTSNAHRSHYMIALLRTSPASKEDRRHGLTQFLIDMTSPGIEVRPIINMAGHHDFNEVIFDGTLVPHEHLIGEVDKAWTQASGELAYERSGPERFLETIFVLYELIRAIGPDPDRASAEGIGRLVAELSTLRQLSVSVAGMLEAGKSPDVEAAMVKELGTNWAQLLPSKARELLPTECVTPGGSFEAVLQQAMLVAPKLTIQGGTREVLRGIIARGLGLR